MGGRTGICSVVKWTRRDETRRVESRRVELRLCLYVGRCNFYYCSFIERKKKERKRKRKRKSGRVSCSDLDTTDRILFKRL